MSAAGFPDETLLKKGMKMNNAKIAIAGCGEIGRLHAKYLVKGDKNRVKCTAVCDISQDNLKLIKEILGDEAVYYDDFNKMLEAGGFDGVLIATPHRFHCDMAIKAFEKGYHVLVEKPAGVYTKEVMKMNEAAKKSGKVFGIMFMERTRQIYQKMHEIVSGGELGELKRVVWIATEWYRPQSYYDLAAWRGTWKGEGGGVLLNQSPHNLDLWQWICGMPVSLRGYCEQGKYHDIEVEDDATIFAKYANGATGVFITSTGEAPGTNRVEISGDRGKLVAEDGKLTFWELKVSEREYNKNCTDPFSEPEYEKHDIEIENEAPLHEGITRNWVDAILGKAELLAPGKEGIKSLGISNAAYLSSWQNGWVDLPIDADKYYESLQKQIMIYDKGQAHQKKR